MATKLCLNQPIDKAIIKENILVHHDLLSSMSYCLMKSGQIIRSHMDEVLSPYDLVTPHLGILIIVKKSAPINQIQLGEQLGIDKATMVKLIDALEKKNFLERIIDPNDRRVRHIKITKEGEKFANQMIKKRIKIENKFLSPFPKKDQELIKDLLPKLLVAFNSILNDP